MPAKKIALSIHAGAGTYPKNLDRTKKIQKKLGQLCQKGYRYLRTHTAVETVAEIVRWLEDWPETNAGTGSMLQSDGTARLSASLMDGKEGKFSGVINIEKIKNPILVAKLLQMEKDRVLSDEGAQGFARKKGFKSFDPRTKKSIERWKDLLRHNTQPVFQHKYGTVGACALDRHGYLAAATSTGGRGMECIGRVSDSATPAGNFANHYAACSATGIGEDIVDESLASTLVMRATDWKSLEKSFRKTFEEAKERHRKFAAIGLDQNGQAFWNQTTDIFYYSSITPYNSKIFNFQ